MSFESEVLIARVRQRGSKLLLPTLLLMIAAFLTTLLASRFDQDWQRITLFSACGALAFFGFLLPLVRYLTTYTDITNSQVVQRSGVIGSYYQTVSLADLSSIEIGSGRSVVLESLGSEPLVIRGLPKPRLIAAEITRLAGARTGRK